MICSIEKWSLSAFVLMLCFFVLMGCTSSDSGLPAHVETARNLVVIDTLQQPQTVFSFERELVFDDSLHLDTIHDVQVDGNGRVYIAGEGWQRRQVHIFDAGGNHLDSLGTFGTGDGDFQRIDHIQLKDGELYLFDTILSRVSIFEGNSYRFREVLPFHADSLKISEKLGIDHVESKPITLLNKDHFVIALHKERNPAYEPEGEVRYTLVNRNGHVLVTELATQPDLRYLVGDYAGRPAPFVLTIPEKPLAVRSSRGDFYMAHTDFFFIRSWDEGGQKQKSWYLPFERHLMDPNEVIHPRFSHNDQLLRVRESAEYPESWPALYSMVVDDRDRIWVSTIPDNRDVLEWWVIDQDNERVHARFTWPFGRKIVRVQNGELYVVEENSQGFENVVKYRVTAAE